DPTGLEELEGDLAHGRVLGSTTDDEHAPGEGERDGDRRDATLEGRDECAHELGGRAQLARERLALARGMSREEAGRGERRHLRLGRGDRELRPGEEREYLVGLVRELPVGAV